MIMLYLLATASMAAAQQISAPDLGAVLDNMEQAQTANHAQYRPYRVVRDFKFFASDPNNVSSRVTAQINFQPPDSKNFVIEESTGSGQGEKIVRRVLEHEMALARDESATEVSRRNYNFELERVDQINGRSCFILKLSPKRNEKDLMRGEVWVDQSTYMIRRIAGELARNPSWWVKEVQLTLEFSDVAGMWLHTATQAVANVRFLGRHSMESHDVNFSTAETVASNVKPAMRDVRSSLARRRVRPGAALASGIGLRP